MKTRIALALVSLLALRSAAVVALANFVIWLLNFDREQAYLDELPTMLFFLSLGWLAVAAVIIWWGHTRP